MNVPNWRTYVLVKLHFYTIKLKIKTMWKLDDFIFEHNPRDVVLKETKLFF